MAELIDKNHVLAHRLFALIGVVCKYPSIPRADLLRLLQPNSLNESLETSGNIYMKCHLCGLIDTAEDKNRLTRLAVSESVAIDFEAFRTYMQHRVLGVISEDADHFVLNEFTAWYAVQDERPLSLNKRQLEASFHEGLYAGREGLVIRDEPGIGAWQSWAEFLGFGWRSEFAVFASDATIRILPLIPELLPEEGFIPFGTFMQRLAVRCPELDGGILFERCWEASRPQERRGNRLSLMLSTGLRVLNRRDVITLESRPDATDNWSLYPAQSYITRVTHIRRGASHE